MVGLFYLFAALGEGYQHRYASLILHIIVTELGNQIALLKNEPDKNIHGHPDRKNQMPERHGGYCPERDEETQHDGMAHMMARTELPIAAGEVLSMQPGGLHVMLVDLRRALVVGDSVPLRLRFRDGTELPVVVPVKTP